MSRRALSDTAYGSLAVYVEYLFGLIASILTARALLPGDMGVYSLLVWVVANAVVIANAGITLGAIKFIAELRGAGREADTARLVRRLRGMQRTMLALVGAALLLVFALFHAQLAPGVPAWVFALLLGAVALRAPYMFNIAVLKGRQDFRSTALVATIGAATNLALIVALWSGRTLPATLPAFVVAYALSSLVFFVVSHRRAMRFASGDAGAGSLPPELEARICHHLCVAGATTVLGAIGASEIELLALNLLGDPAHAGLFKVANALASGVALLVPGVLGAQLLPMMAKAHGSGGGEAGRRFVAMTTWLWVLGAPLIAAGSVFADHAIGLLYGAAYAAASPVLVALLVARTAAVLGQGATAYLLSADRQTALMRLTLLFTALRAIGAFAGTWLGGLDGAVAATVALSLLATIATVRLALRVSATTLPWARLLRIGAAAAVPALACLPFARHLSPLWGLVAGTAAFAMLYPAALWLLRGLDAEDASHVRAMAAKLRRRTAS
jgi:O-antigen/teichoic acid export membrane protein